MNKSTFYLTYLLFLISFGSISCYKYKYEIGIKEYMKNVFHINTLAIFNKMIILPIHSCEPCVNNTIHNLILRTNKSKTVLIITGKITYSYTFQIQELIKKGYRVIHDRDNKIIGYETNVGIPYLFHLDWKGKITKAISLENFDWKNFKNDPQY